VGIYNVKNFPGINPGPSFKWEGREGKERERGRGRGREERRGSIPI
jgi:hypothetical protein